MYSLPSWSPHYMTPFVVLTVDIMRADALVLVKHVTFLSRDELQEEGWSSSLSFLWGFVRPPLTTTKWFLIEIKGWLSLHSELDLSEPSYMQHRKSDTLQEDVLLFSTWWLYAAFRQVHMPPFLVDILHHILGKQLESGGSLATGKLTIVQLT